MDTTMSWGCKSVVLGKEAWKVVPGLLSSVQDGICTLGKAYMRFTFPQRCFCKQSQCSYNLKEDRLALSLSTPLYSRRSMVWCPWPFARRQCHVRCVLTKKTWKVLSWLKGSGWGPWTVMRTMNSNYSVNGMSKILPSSKGRGKHCPLQRGMKFFPVSKDKRYCPSRKFIRSWMLTPRQPHRDSSGPLI